MPFAFLGLPSLHEIIQAIASGFFGALAHALVPSWLVHGTVAMIQHLVALPDPATWTHVGQLQGDMTYLAAMLLPVTLAVSTVRYWLVGLTGAAHPVGAVSRSVGVTFVLVAYRWFVEETVAATNTLTHGILALPVVSDGLQRIIGVLFGGALLVGAGGVFGAFLVIVGVLFAASLFALQVLLTVLLALLIVCGPPLIALSTIPELSHLARSWAHALLAVTLVPLAWTVLFATAGALCLDATSFTGGAGGVPGHIVAAFAGLITFVLAVKLPLMLIGEMRHLVNPTSISRGASNSTPGQSAMPGTERVRAAHARLRSTMFDGVPSLGRSAGRAAGALGAPEGGPLGAARRGLANAARRNRILPGAVAGGTAGGAVTGALAGSAVSGGAGRNGRRGVRQRLRDAGVILANAPRDARAAMRAASRKADGSPAMRGSAARGPTRRAKASLGSKGASATSTGGTPARVSGEPPRRGRTGKQPSQGAGRSSRAPRGRPQGTPSRMPDARKAPTPAPRPGSEPRPRSGGTSPAKPPRGPLAPSPPVAKPPGRSDTVTPSPPARHPPEPPRAPRPEQGQPRRDSDPGSGS